MRLFSCIAIALLFSVSGRAGGFTWNPGDKTTIFVSNYENVLGTSMQLKMAASSEAQSTHAETVVLKEISRMSSILSAYDASSEFSQWQKTHGTPVHVSKELFEVLSLFDQWREKTGGALDASAEVVSRVWKAAAARNELPSSSEIAKAVAEIKKIHWILDARKQTATHLSDAPLMLNSFTKSYIISHAGSVAMGEAGLAGIIVNIGGDMVVLGNMRERVMISDPKADAENDRPLSELMLENKAVATSGNYRRGEMIGGRWYSHIVDPRSGIPADEIISATVVSSDAAEAGALATAFNVMSQSDIAQLMAHLLGVEYLIITKNGERRESKGWKSLEVSPDAHVMPADLHKEKEAGTWDDDFELSISLEINLVKEGFAKRPYVAVWVEDENHAPVRTISLWRGNLRYLPELKSWYMKYRGTYNEDQNFSRSVTSATRSAGKYTVKWDGKDDHGSAVKAGKYTVKIEVSREHGTYQLMRQDIDLDSNPKLFNITGNIEIASASIDYHKKNISN
jgi:thiamine biosynthesis lipoprotein